VIEIVFLIVESLDLLSTMKKVIPKAQDDKQ